MNRYDFALGKTPPEDSTPNICNDLLDVWSHFKPKNLEEAVTFLIKMHANNLLFSKCVPVPLANKYGIVALLTEDQFVDRCHHGIGQQIRNDWGLWRDSDLAKHFKEMGIEHADDMSGIILTTVYRQIKGKPWDLVGQIKIYQDYWANLRRSQAFDPAEDSPDWQGRP